MKFEELLKFIEIEDKRLKERLGNYTKIERILARNVKLAEELGELSNDVLAEIGDLRKEKMEKYNRNNLSNEIADVIIVTLLLAKSLDVDIKKALEEKIKKIHKRYE